MPAPRKQRLHKTITALQGKHGAEIIDTGPTLLQRLLVPPHVSTGVPCLDALTGCKGIPVGHLILLTGRTTSGKLTLSYSILANAQGISAKNKDRVAILDVVGTSNPDYIARRCVDLDHTLFVRPPRPEHAVQLLFDLLRGAARQWPGQPAQHAPDHESV
jgi:RecA/RadA recombinase